MKEFEEKAASHASNIDELKKADEFLKKLQSVRKDAFDKGYTSSVLFAYSEVIGFYIEIFEVIGTHDAFGDVGEVIASQSVLQQGKEYFSQLGARSAYLIAADDTFQALELQGLSEANNGVSSTLNLSVLKLNLAPKDRESLNNLLISKDWSLISGNSEKLADKQKEGKFGIDLSAHSLAVENMNSEMFQITEKSLDSVLSNIKYEKSMASFRFGLVSVLTLLGMVVTSVLAIFVVTRVNKGIEKLAETLMQQTSSVYTSATKLSENVHSLSASSNEQAAAVQETVASMAEMNGLLNQTSRASQDAHVMADKVHQKSEEGARTMQSLITAMEYIQQSNAQIENMSNIISEISAKTTVINDIVFKTQLLSFNASIEAARAGVHGKGFAVVAEEVGNLAHLSGGAAREIQTLLLLVAKKLLKKKMLKTVNNFFIEF